MPIDSKECFAALTEDGQLWEIYQAAQSGGGGGGITSINGNTNAAQTITGTAPISVSSAAGTTTIKTSMNTARLLGRTTAGVGVAEEISVGTGLSLSGGTLSSTVFAGVTSVTATAPLTSSGGATPDISTSINTNRIIGRSTAGTGVMEQLTPVGITVSGGNITGIGGTVGAVDNAIPRADGTGGFTVQGSDIVIDDATTATQNNVAITNQHTGQTNSSLVLIPKGTGAFILGPKPDGTATGGNARGSRAVDLQTSRTNSNQVASNAGSTIIGGANNRSSGQYSTAGGDTCQATSYASVAFGQLIESTGDGSGVCGGIANKAQARGSGILAGERAIADRHGMQSHSAGRFAADGDAQRARFVLRCKTTTNSAVEMALDGSTTYLGIPSGKVIACTINISGIKSDGSAVAHYVRQYAVKNVGGTSSEVYAPVTIGSDNAAGTTIALSANNADDTLRIAVTGIAAETWRWVASVDAVEIGYGT